MLDWISIDDKSPEYGKRILLVITKRGNIEYPVQPTRWVDFGRYYHGYFEDAEGYWVEVTHWALPPEPPMEVQWAGE